ncbi:MAG: hypothetical protein KIT36_22020 [Alphaproteobacteria bacterium]|nr:hypothetical protein [Alphaproteobacteria bacterium]
MQAAIEELIKFGPLPDEDNVEPETVDAYGALLDKIELPVTDEEARALAKLFGQDSCYGLAWPLVRAIESAPGWPLGDVLRNASDNEWIDSLMIRARNAGLID